jgi:hypothetical protein
MGVALSFAFLAVSFLLHARNSERKKRSVRLLLIDFIERSQRPCAIVLVGIGILGMVGSVVLCVVVRREGLLESANAYTLRMPDNLEVVSLIGKNEIVAGDPIANFRSPEREAKYTVLHLRCKSLEAQQAALKCKPDEPDQRLVHRQQELETEYRHLRETLERFTIEHRGVLRQKVREVQAKKAQIIELDSELHQLPQAQIQTQAELKTKTRQLLRLKKLQSTKAVAEQEVDQIVASAAVLEAEVEKLRAKGSSAKTMFVQAQKDLGELETMLNQQSAKFEAELINLRDLISTVQQQQAELEKELSLDLEKAKERNLPNSNSFALNWSSAEKRWRASSRHSK